MNKIIFCLTLFILSHGWTDAPVEMGDNNVRRLSQEVEALQRYIYKRFGGDPAYQAAGATPPEDPSQTMLLEKVQGLNDRLAQLTSKFEEMDHALQTLKTSNQKIQQDLETKIALLEKQLSETKDTVKQTEDSAYQDKLNKMSADELAVHIETSGKMLPEDRLEKALRLFVSKYSKHAKVSTIYKDLTYLTYKHENYKEAALFAGEFYKKTPNAPEAPEILLMMAFALNKMEKQKEACLTVDKIKKDYSPLSAEFEERLTEAQTSFSCPV